MKDLLKRIGLKIARIRKEKGMTQMELADKAGIHRAYIGHIERGEKNLSLSTLQKIAKALDKEIWELIK